MLSRCTLLAFAATVVPLVAAHGHMSRALVDGVEFPGPVPGVAGAPSAIRQIDSVEPVKGTNNRDLFCGRNAALAAQVANATQGSVLEFSWVNGDGGPWVHQIGPVMTYMASCGTGGCATFDDRSASFFKISQLGRKDNGDWTVTDLNSDVKATTSATIPPNLPNGEYLVRHELIGMHNGNQAGGVEFYPACLQVRLSGGSSTSPLPSGPQVVTFPGGYSETDPGIFDADIYNRTAPYIFPGPQPVNATGTINARSRVMRNI